MSSTPLFRRYIGIDYSGAQTPTSSLKGLRVYSAEPEVAATEVQPPVSSRKYWTRRGIAEWLVNELADDQPTLVGIDHAFSFPLQYFEKYSLPRNWSHFLEDFHQHWPTDEDHVYVDFVRDGVCGTGSMRCGDTRWRRLTEIRTKSAKSVFHFDVQGSVAKSTHAGLTWLRFLRHRLKRRIHVWPFDGWEIPDERAVVAEVYPRLFSRQFPLEHRSPDQHDAYSIAEWMRRSDSDGDLVRWLTLPSADADRAVAEVEGWILGSE